MVVEALPNLHLLDAALTMMIVGVHERPAESLGEPLPESRLSRARRTHHDDGRSGADDALSRCTYIVACLA